MSGGLVWTPSRKDIMAEKVFGSTSSDVKPLGRVEELLASPLAQFPLYQATIPSCVTCAATFLNMWYSWKADNTVELSWPFIYALVKKYGTGTRPQDVADILRHVGQVRDGLMPQENYLSAGSEFYLSPEYVTEEMKQLAIEFQIGDYVFFQNTTPEALQSHLEEGPIMIGIGINVFDWNTFKDIPKPDRVDLYHCVLLLDRDEEWNGKVLSWDKPDALDIRTIRRDYPIEFALQFKDLPDDVNKRDVRRGIWQMVLDRLKQRC